MAANLSKILIVIPLYNHGKTVLNVIERCRKIHEKVLVIDDGSTDLKKDFFKDMKRLNADVICLQETKATVEQIALRFGMPDREGSYHMPVILNPNSYSMWCSA